jgi:hypothetical protein
LGANQGLPGDKLAATNRLSCDSALGYLQAKVPAEFFIYLDLFLVYLTTLSIAQIM